MTVFWLGVLLLTAGQSSAEDAYRAGDFAEARRLFTVALIQPGAAEEVLLHNLGNCAFRTGEFAEARLFYERALLRQPSDEETRFNLEMTLGELGIPGGASSPVGALLDWLNGVAPWVLLVVVVILKSTGLLGLLSWRGGVLGRIAFGLILLAGLAGSLRLIQVQWFPGSPDAIVLKRGLAVRMEPSVDLPGEFALRSGELVSVEEVAGTWRRIGHSRGEGWVESTGLGMVE